MKNGLFRKYPFLSSFSVLFIFTFAVFGVFTPYFQANDDIFKLFFAKGVGAGLAPSEYLGYTNIIAGFLLRTLYQAFPTFPWYGWYLFVPVFGGLWALTSSFCLLPHAPLKLYLLGFASLGVFLYLFFQLSWDISPMMATLGGLFLFSSLMENSSAAHRAKGLFLCGCLFFAAAMIRLDGFILMATAGAPFLCRLLRRRKENILEKRTLIFLSLLFVLIGSAVGFSHCYYQRDAGWKVFLKQNDFILGLKDYRVPQYTEKTKPIFEKIGWSKNDFDLFMDFFYQDEVKYSNDNFKTLIGIFPRFVSNGKPGSISSLMEILNYPSAAAALACFLAFLLFCPKNQWLPILMDLAWSMLLILFLVYFFRAPERIFLPVLCFPLCLCLYSAAPSGGILNSSPYLLKFFRWIALVFLLLFLAPVIRFYFHYDRLLKSSELALNQAMETIQPRSNQLFVVWDSSFPYEYTSAFDNYEKFRNFHIYPLAVYQRSPHGAAMLQHFGIGDLVKEMINNPNVFLICHGDEALYLSRYLQEKYAVRRTTFQKTFASQEYPWLSVYRVGSAPP